MARQRSGDKLVFNSTVTDRYGNAVTSGDGSVVKSRGMPKPAAATPAPKKAQRASKPPSSASAGVSSSGGPPKRNGPRGLGALFSGGPSTRGGPRRTPSAGSPGPSKRAIVVGTAHSGMSTRTALNSAIRQRGTPAGKDLERVANRRSKRDGGYR